MEFIGWGIQTNIQTRIHAKTLKSKITIHNFNAKKLLLAVLLAICILNSFQKNLMDLLTKFKGKIPFLLEMSFDLNRLHELIDNELNLTFQFQINCRFVIVFLNCFLSKIRVNINKTYAFLELN
jgi:hypothetical protein